MLTFLPYPATPHVAAANRPAANRIEGRGAPAAWSLTPRTEALRARLREAGARLYALHGIDGVSISDIAMAATIAPGSAAHAFPRRRDLLFDIAHAHVDALHEYVGRAGDALADAAPRERLEAMALALLDAMFEQRDAHRVTILAEPSLTVEQRDLLRFRMRTLAHRIAAVVADTLPALAGRREYQAPLTRMLMAMAADAPAWFRENGTLTRRDYARLIVRGVVNGGDAMLAAEAA